MFTAQLTLRTLVVAHACLKTYQRARQTYRWVHPPAACLWNSFVYVDVVPDDGDVGPAKKISSLGENGGEEERAGRLGDEGGTQEEETGGWVRL